MVQIKSKLGPKHANSWVFHGTCSMPFSLFGILMPKGEREEVRNHGNLHGWGQACFLFGPFGIFLCLVPMVAFYWFGICLLHFTHELRFVIDLSRWWTSVTMVLPILCNAPIGYLYVCIVGYSLEILGGFLPSRGREILCILEFGNPWARGMNSISNPSIFILWYRSFIFWYLVCYFIWYLLWCASFWSYEIYLVILHMLWSL